MGLENQTRCAFSANEDLMIALQGILDLHGEENQDLQEEESQDLLFVLHGKEIQDLLPDLQRDLLNLQEEENLALLFAAHHVILHEILLRDLLVTLHLLMHGKQVL